MQYNDIRRAKVESDLIFQFQEKSIVERKKKIRFSF